jgi:hypothetical protein
VDRFTPIFVGCLRLPDHVRKIIVETEDQIKPMMVHLREEGMVGLAVLGKPELLSLSSLSLVFLIDLVELANKKVLYDALIEIFQSKLVVVGWGLKPDLFGKTFSGFPPFKDVNNYIDVQKNYCRVCVQPENDILPNASAFLFL